MISAGRVERMIPLEHMQELRDARAAGASSPLYQAVHRWLEAQRSGAAPLV
jgi:hypothetical protein